MMYRIRSAIIKIIVSILASIAYRISSFGEHYRGPKYLAVLQDFDNFLRSKIKYTDHQGSYDDARDELWAQLKDRNIDLWE